MAAIELWPLTYEIKLKTVLCAFFLIISQSKNFFFTKSIYQQCRDYCNSGFKAYYGENGLKYNRVKVNKTERSCKNLTLFFGKVSQFSKPVTEQFRIFVEIFTPGYSKMDFKGKISLGLQCLQHVVTFWRNSSPVFFL